MKSLPELGNNDERLSIDLDSKNEYTEYPWNGR